jgi:hypothetical protein
MLGFYQISRRYIAEHRDGSSVLSILWLPLYHCAACCAPQAHKRCTAGEVQECLTARNNRVS